MTEQQPTSADDEFEATSLDDLDEPPAAAPTGPYAAAALAYLAAGWHGVLPLPPRSKAYPPIGYTGRYGAVPSYPDVQAWTEDRPTANICLRLPPNVIGVDVDHYGSKRGGDTLAALEVDLGALPPTWRVTSRDDGISGIRMFRVPSGLRWPGVFGDAIESIRMEHRYAVTWPSVHPEGGTYRWIDPSGTTVIGVIPRPEELPELPDAWVAHFTHGQADVDHPKADLADGQVMAWLTSHGQGEPCGRMRAVVDRILDRPLTTGRSRHETVLELTDAIVLLAAEGHDGALAALHHVAAAFIATVKDDRAGGEPEAADEYARMVNGAVRQAAAKYPQPATADPCADPLSSLDGLITPEDRARQRREQPYEPGAGGQQGDPVEAFDLERDEFWQFWPVLSDLRQAARARLSCPWSTLGKALVQVVGRIEPNVVLPPIIGTDASLNLFVGLVGPSGTGKGASEGVAAGCLIYNVHGLVGADLTEVNAGSGEGIAHTYLHYVRGGGDDGKKGHVEQFQTRAAFRIAEVDAFGALKGRSGSTLATELRSAWNGEALGFAYADTTRRLPLAAHSYRLCLTVGIQPGRAAVLLDDADGGTPQRFLWLPTQDAGIPDQEPPMPEPRTWTHPWLGMEGQPRIQMDVCEQARQTIVHAARDRHRGKVDALDGHALLCRLKVAAALAILHGDTAVTDDAWMLSGHVMAVSDHTRAEVVRTLADHADEVTRARGRSDAIRQGIVDDAAVEKATRRIANAILRHLSGGEWEPHNTTRKRLAGRDRCYFDDAIARLVSAGIVEMTRTPNAGPEGCQYRLVQGHRP